MVPEKDQDTHLARTDRYGRKLNLSPKVTAGSGFGDHLVSVNIGRIREAHV